ncbi:hypothetical protein PM10SUCC1_28480 [Propionigenium maris DSM 9537]|uniref:Transposase n=1 Tax=Propionigenium maris DSM 9537 TaxID=1123000 RepID=A0A9W6LNV9_9FUSO|nr:hypothetical protein [Propionigenium maris]GLI57334.1 hypothetical protein PM10SUCC1_28480 [Propionigenium maris DSM 9537]
MCSSYNKDLEKALNRARKNIYVSKAVSRLKRGTWEYLEYLRIFSHKYREENVKAALRDLYSFNREIKDIKGLTAALVRKNYNLQ